MVGEFTTALSQKTYDKHTAVDSFLCKNTQSLVVEFIVTDINVKTGSLTTAGKQDYLEKNNNLSFHISHVMGLFKAHLHSYLHTEHLSIYKKIDIY